MNFMPIYQKYLQWRDRWFPMGNILRHTQYVLVFKTTNWCWYNCPHCCESAGPKNPRTFMPADIICDYLAQVARDPCFSKEVVFTGGEIMSAYRFGPADYVSTLLNKSLDLGFGTDIKTNAAWARAGFGERIFSDLTHVVQSHRPYAMQISLSLDRYHKNALDNNVRVISRMAKTPNVPVIIHVSGFNGHVDMFPALLAELRNNKIRVEKGLCGNSLDNLSVVYRLDNDIILKPSRGTLFDGGRAANMAGAHHIKFPQFTFLTSDRHHLVAFDSFGRVTLGENSGRKISTKWRTPHGAKDLMHVRADLVRATWNEELRARIFDGWRFREK